MIKADEELQVKKAAAGDAKTPDQQGGQEIGMRILNEYLIGNNLVHGMGYLESGMTAGLESLVICDEVVDLVKRYGRGVDFSPEHLALEVIDEVGSKGNKTSPIIIEHSSLGLKIFILPGT